MTRPIAATLRPRQRGYLFWGVQWGLLAAPELRLTFCARSIRAISWERAGEVSRTRLQPCRYRATNYSHSRLIVLHRLMTCLVAESSAAKTVAQLEIAQALPQGS